MSDPYQSITKGVFVIPFEPNGAAGPSKPYRPLKRVYDKAFEAYQAAHEVYESSRTSEALDHIADWLDRSSVPSTVVPIYRIPIAVIQSISPALPALLPTLLKHAHTIQARDAQDLPTAIRGIAVGFMGEEAIIGKRSGRTGIDEVESWWSGLKDRPPLLLHIEQAQMIPSHVLAELTYVLTLHPQVPFRLLCSVPFTTTFLSSWTHIEPSTVDLSVLHVGRSRKKGAATNAILKAGIDPTRAPITIGADLEEELRRREEMTGGGPNATLKALKWNLLRHSMATPLRDIQPLDHGNLTSLVKARTSLDNGDMLAHTLFELDTSADLGNVIDPAPRLAIRQALSEPSLYVTPDLNEEIPSHVSPSTPQKASHHGVRPGTSSAKSRKYISDPPPPVTAEDSAAGVQAGDIKDLETLFSLWKSAGRLVNLWDWLEGFRSTVAHHMDGGERNGEDDENNNPHHHDPGDSGQRKRATSLEHTEGQSVSERGTQTRLHATFVRFCEEARMLGLVRARGKGTGKRGDEVVKGIGLI